MPETVDSINELNEDLFNPEEADSFSDPLKARRKAMDYLARREYGRLELIARLEKAGFNAEIARIAVDRLAVEHLQCDRRFIEDFIQSRINKGNGPVRIRLELEERMLDAGLVDEIISECDTDWAALSRKTLEKKFGRDPTTDFGEKARRMRFLQYRGFEPAQIQWAIQPHGGE